MEIDNNEMIQDVNVDIERNSEEMQQQIPAEEQDNVNKENVPDRQPGRNRRRIRMFDEETELTNEQILEMRRSVVDDLNKAEITAREKIRIQESKNQLNNLLYTPGKPFLAPQLASLWEQHCAPMLYDENVKRRRIQPFTSVINLNEHDDFDADGPSIPRGVRDSRNSRNDEPERLRKEGSQQSSAIISGIESSGLDKYPEIVAMFRWASMRRLISRMIEY
ncbi:hypothetical protein C1645_557261 [Glomus cerebriforme]|uniref:Uncharacterized protein n=1 Tax=Glomus cerebriforme TaxID=658196 RepID=A0A397TL82_9GLOM|nr:hypothetical protein C1645_557261 [Glomus cerebriforme]